MFVLENIKKPHWIRLRVYIVQHLFPKIASHMLSGSPQEKPEGNFSLPFCALNISESEAYCLCTQSSV